MSYTWKRHVTCMTESCRTTLHHVRSVLQSVALCCSVFAVCLQCACSVLFMRLLYVMHVCASTHSCVCNDSLTWVPWPIRIARTRNTNMRSFLFHACAVTHPCVCHDSSTCVPWLHEQTLFFWFRMLDMTHPLESCYRHDQVMSHIWSSRTQKVHVFRCLLEAMMFRSMTHSRVWHCWAWRSYACDMT